MPALILDLPVVFLAGGSADKGVPRAARGAFGRSHLLLSEIQQARRAER
jgi:hypothetical protein